MELKKNPASVMTAAIDSAKTTSLIKTMRANGASDQEVANAVLGDEEDMDALVKNMAVLFILGTMGVYFNYTNSTNPAMLGYAYIAQHYTDAPQAKEFQDFYDRAKTCGDVYNFFCEKAEINPDKIKTFTGYDDIWFTTWLNTKLDGPHKFGLNKEHSELVWKQMVNKNE